MHSLWTFIMEQKMKTLVPEIFIALKSDVFMRCAGMVGAVCNNAMGVCGVNQAVKVMGCKFLDGSGNGWESL